ncbi:hypothetical protein QK289_03825 [Exiguobacterium antarcticum]|uniref:ComG operon protein 6 n=1 Tax=Exiguobacterium antarcticum TaxID=132920 RepID=A0ABT6QZK1_9BACL|nr:hypothetical protein [Exiguobacterium antarcticum]MDI3234126.1 hypothetical protein [Exiguobacterium antarcticum]
MLLISLITMTHIVSTSDYEQRMEEELFFHTIERLMWRSISCEKVGEEVRGVDVDPEEEPVKWRLVRVQNQIRLKKEFGGELTYAHNVDTYQVRQDGQTLIFELNQRQRTVQCRNKDSS